MEDEYRCPKETHCTGLDEVFVCDGVVKYNKENNCYEASSNDGKLVAKCKFTGLLNKFHKAETENKPIGGTCFFNKMGRDLT